MGCIEQKLLYYNIKDSLKVERELYYGNFTISSLLNFQHNITQTNIAVWNPNTISTCSFIIEKSYNIVSWFWKGHGWGWRREEIAESKVHHSTDDDRQKTGQRSNRSVRLWPCMDASHPPQLKLISRSYWKLKTNIVQCASAHRLCAVHEGKSSIKSFPSTQKQTPSNSFFLLFPFSMDKLMEILLRSRAR